MILQVIKIFLFNIFLLASVFSFAQIEQTFVSSIGIINKPFFATPITPNTYKIELKKELCIVVPSAALFITGLILEPKSLTISQLSTLDINDIPAFERDIIYFDSADAHKADVLSDKAAVFTYGIGLGSVILSMFNNDKISNAFILYGEGLLVTAGLTEIIKKTVGRVRPYAYNPEYSDAHRTDASSTLSFPSGHTSSSAYNCFFAAKLIDDYFILDNKYLYRTLDYTLAAILPAYVGYLRTAAGQHFTTDVIGGYVFGAASGFLIPDVHKNKNMDVSIYPFYRDEGNGITLSLIF